jgi:hypothetical protein
LGRLWNLDIESGLHFLFGDFKCKLWSKEGFGVTYVVWLLTIKIKKWMSNDLRLEHVIQHYNDLIEGYNFANWSSSKFICKCYELRMLFVTQLKFFWGFHLRIPRNLNFSHFNVIPIINHIIYYMKESDASYQIWNVWI